MRNRICESLIIEDDLTKIIERYNPLITAICCSRLFITEDPKVWQFSNDTKPKHSGKVWLFTPSSKITNAHLAAFHNLTKFVSAKLIKGERADSWLVPFGQSFITILREDGFKVKELILG